MREHGDIIAVKKKDKMEIVVSEKYVQKVLTDETNFSFEQGVADVRIQIFPVFEIYIKWLTRHAWGIGDEL
jgi:nitrogen regulatory protein PII